MMSEDNNNMVALATPTRFLIESGEWDLTPNITGSIHHEMNPFDCNFQQPQQRVKTTTTNGKWSPPSPTVTTTTTASKIMYTTSPEPDNMATMISPPTPPMSLSQSPSSSSASFSFKSEPTTTQQLYTSPQQQFVEPPTQRRTSSRQTKQQVFFSDYLEDNEVEYKPTKTASVQSGRKRRIVFEGDDAEARRKKFLERNRVAAYKCRQKKKNWMQDLEQKAENQNSHNDELRSLVAQLKEESMYLRNLLLTHGNCDCDSVQAYLRKTSAEITSKSSPMSMSSRRNSMNSSSYATMPPPPPAIPSYNGSFSSIPSFTTESTSTGLIPFLNTVSDKPNNPTKNSSDSSDYFSQSHNTTNIA